MDQTISNYQCTMKTISGRKSSFISRSSLQPTHKAKCGLSHVTFHKSHVTLGSKISKKRFDREDLSGHEQDATPLSAPTFNPQY